MQKKFDEKTAKQIKAMAGELNKHAEYRGDKKIIVNTLSLQKLLDWSFFEITKRFGSSTYYEILLTPEDIRTGTYNTENIKKHLLPNHDHT